ncbi:hypothetical protein FHG87_016913 [Trinorchestia longiramus]|nr:hypothetical protein FHG87_016913 [Trinorchestia longiramus]
MGHGGLVWCAGIGGLWCSLSALALLLAALISPHWALTTEPLVLDDPYPYYADLDYPLHLRHRPSYLSSLQPHSQFDQISSFHKQMPQLSQFSGQMSSPTSFVERSLSQSFGSRKYLHSSHNSQTLTSKSLDGRESMLATQKPRSSFGGSGDLKYSLPYRHRTKRSDSHRTATSRFYPSLAFPINVNKVDLFLNISNDQQNVNENVHIKRDVSDHEHSTLKAMQNGFSADETTNTYVVVEESSDVVYKGVNISEWINPFNHRSRFQEKGVNLLEQNGKQLGVLPLHSRIDESKHSGIHYNVAAASSYPSSPPISSHLGPQSQLLPVFEGRGPGRSIPLKRPEGISSQIYYPTGNPSQIFRNDDKGSSQTDHTRQKTKLPSADSDNSKAVAHDNIETTAPQKTWSGWGGPVDLYQDDHDSHERHDDQTSVSTAAFRLGLWSVCPSVNISSINLVLLAPRCSPISYITVQASERTWGLPGPTPLTLSVVARVRISTPFLLCSCVLLLLGAVLAVAGRCSHQQAALLATLLFTLAGEPPVLVHHLFWCTTCSAAPPVLVHHLF